MLRIISSLKQLEFSKLMYVYFASNQDKGCELFPHLSVEAQILEAEQDFYQYLNEIFFRQNDTFYAVWEEDGLYRSALRIEPYQDGLLLCALETAPNDRNKGYATILITEVQNYLNDRGCNIIYSHVSKKNNPSLATHKKCGFQIIKDHAVYSDGSVYHNSYTLLFNGK